MISLTSHTVLLGVGLHAANEETAAVSDPVTQSAFTFLSGAAVAALIALFGAWVQSRREHSRWLRERRFEAYKGLLVENDFLHLGVSRASEDVRFTGDDKKKAAEAVSLLGLVGPARMYNVAGRYQTALVGLLGIKGGEITDEDWAPIEKLRTELVIAMQKALGVPTAERFGPRSRWKTGRPGSWPARGQSHRK